MELIFAFMAVSFITVASPGPTTLFVVRQGAKQGLPSALGGVAGILMADTLFLVAGAVGVGAAFAAADWLLTVLKLVGACYFAWLAWRMGAPYLRPAARRALGAAGQSAASQSVSTESAQAPVAPALAVAMPATVWGTLRQALTMHLVNVKALLYFAMLVPQFVVADQPLGAQVGKLLGLHLLIAATVLSSYALVGTALRRTPVGGGAAKLLDMVGSGVMASLSLGILATI